MKSAIKTAIIDSGIGGISILNKLIARFQSGSFIYIADNKYMPYGEKTESKVIDRIRYLINLAKNKFKCDEIIIACNTASIIINGKDEFYDIKKLSFNKSGVYLTTNLTASKIDKRVIALDGLASRIEEYILDEEKIDNLILGVIEKYHLNRYKKLVLGCTHYELVGDVFRKYLNNTIILDNSYDLIDKINASETKNLRIKIYLTKKSLKYKNKIMSLIKK